MISKEDFNKVWKDSTKEDILNQFYWEHIAIRKAIEFINTNEWAKYYEISSCRMKLLNILENGSNDNE